jgi:hypothetical protein
LQDFQFGPGAFGQSETTLERGKRMSNLGRRWSSWQKKAAVYSTLLVGLVVMLIAVPVVSQAGEAELKMEIDRLWAKLANIEGVSTGEARGEVRHEIRSEENWADRVTISGVVEAGVYDGDDATVPKSDIALATVELGVDAEVSEYSSAHVLFLSEDGGGLGVDEAFITIGNTEKNPLYMTAGKMYVPFGNFETQMISDPLTLGLGETGEDAFLLGVDAAGFYASVYAFNGDAADGVDDKIEHYGTNVGFAFESDAVSIDVGGGWISSIQDSDGMTEAITTETGSMVVTEYIGGYAAHLIAAFGPVTLIGEYVGADDDIITGTNSQISAYNVEAGVAFPLAGKEAGFAVGFQTTDDALWAGAPEERIVAAFVFGFMDGTSLALEYLHEEDYSIADGGLGLDWDTYTLQLAAEF